MYERYEKTGSYILMGMMVVSLLVLMYLDYTIIPRAMTTIMR